MADSTQIIKTVAGGYNGNQLTPNTFFNPDDERFNLSMDYLILNLECTHSNKNDALKVLNNGVYKLVKLDKGTKTFKDVYEVYQNTENIATLFTTPYSSVLSQNLCQLQFNNHVFYTKTLSQIELFTRDFCDFAYMKYTSVNRLDIALDLNNSNQFYQTTISRILNQNLIVSGKDKKITPYYVTEKGAPILTGFAIGSRSGSRFLRCYNKSLEIQKKPKEYILETWKNIGLDISNVWRFEYQLNNTFFRFLKKSLNVGTNDPLTETLTWGIFDIRSLFQLLKMATKNHFDIKYNTGKSQINKEQDFCLINWEYLKTKLSAFTSLIVKIKTLAKPTILTVKRMVKGLFREYYNSKQTNISQILALNDIINNNTNQLNRLDLWFKDKTKFYLSDFRSKQITDFHFDYELLNEHLTYAI